MSTPKNKKNRKKKGGKSKINGDTGKVNGVKIDTEDAIEHDDAEGEEQVPETPTEPPSSPQKAEADHVSLTNGTSRKPIEVSDHVEEVTSEENNDAEDTLESTAKDAIPDPQQDATEISSADTNERLEALARERDALREEVAQARRSLEEIQEKHEVELSSIREQLAETQGEKEQAESQYRSLLGKVNTIKFQLGERLKADAASIFQSLSAIVLILEQEDLSQARSRIEELEEQCGSLREENEARTTELAAMSEEAEQKSKELSTLRNRTTLSQQNWAKEREDLIQREAYAREDLEAAKQAMQDWEVLAMEERSIRESIAERVADLEEQVATHREAHERAAAERDTQSLTVDGLQRALQEIQDSTSTASGFPMVY